MVEKKNADFLAWFLELLRYFAEVQVASSSSENPGMAVGNPGMTVGTPRLTVAGLMRQTVNTPATNGATALHIAASLKMEPSLVKEKTHILKLLLMYGAEFSSRTDSKLRTELSRDPEVCSHLSFTLYKLYV